MRSNSQCLETRASLIVVLQSSFPCHPILTGAHCSAKAPGESHSATAIGPLFTRVTNCRRLRLTGSPARPSRLQTGTSPSETLLLWNSVAVAGDRAAQANSASQRSSSGNYRSMTWWERRLLFGASRCSRTGITQMRPKLRRSSRSKSGVRLADPTLALSTMPQI